MTGLTGRSRLLVMIGIGMGMLLAALDQTIIATAMPNVVAHLGGFDLYAWAFTSYMLVSTASVPLYGKLSDLYGRKIFFLAGMIIFMLGSMLSGQAQTMHQLIAFRGLQGLGAGALMPVALAVIGDLFPPGKRGQVQGLMGTVFGISSIVGPTLGGYITDNLSWRWVFYVNLPVGLAAIAVVLLTMPWDRRDHHARSIDYLGAAALVAGVVPLLLGFSQAGSDYAWTSTYILSLFAGSAVMLGVFVFVESRAKEPIIPLDLFRNGIFSVSVLAVFITAMGMFGAIMFIPLFVQAVVGASATNSGYVLTPMMLSLIVGSTLSGQLIQRWGRYRAIGAIGLSVMVLGMFLLSRMGVETTNATVIRNMIVTGLGLGTTMPLYVIAVQNAFPHARLGVVTSSVQFFRSIGGTIGVAVLGSFMNETFARRLSVYLEEADLRNVPPDVLQGISNPEALLEPGAQEELTRSLGAGGAEVAARLFDAIRLALADATARTFLIGTVLVAAAWVVNWFLREIPLRMTHEATEEMITAEPVIPLPEQSSVAVDAADRHVSPARPAPNQN